MAHIGIDTEDLTLLSKDIDEMKIKLDKVKQIINTKFTVSKDYELYLDGFNKLNEYLEVEIDKMTTLKSKIEKYQGEISDIEKHYIEQFSDLAVPTISYNGSNLSIVSPTENINQNNPPVENKQNKSSDGTGVIYNTTSNNEKSGGVNMAGVIAGAIGAIGIGSAIAAATLSKDKEEKEKEDKEKEGYYGVSNNS